jgi:hypothetical protein
MSASRCASELAVLLAVGALGLLSAPRVAIAQEANQPTSFSHRMAQGRFFLDAGMAHQALGEFEAAALLPEGQAEPEVHQLLARTRYRLGEIGGAVEAARTAAALVPRMDPEFAEFHDFLTSRFGKVLIVGSASTHAVRPTPAVPLLDPELKRAFEEALVRLDAMDEGSTSIYMPVGSYRVGEHIVEVVAKGATRMDLRPTVDASGSGVYGERKGGERRGGERKGGAGSKGSKAPTSPPTGALLLQGGGTGYAQQGSGSAGLRGAIGAELGVAGDRVFLSAGLLGALGRAERIQGAQTPPPAGGGGVRLEVSAAGPAGAVRLGPLLAGSLVGLAPFTAALPEGYAGPTRYLVQGPEVGLRVEGPGEKARPVIEVFGFVTESTPLGVASVRDGRPHLTAGAGLDVGVRLR